MQAAADEFSKEEATYASQGDVIRDIQKIGKNLDAKVRTLSQESAALEKEYDAAPEEEKQKIDDAALAKKAELDAANSAYKKTLEMYKSLRKNRQKAPGKSEEQAAPSSPALYQVGSAF